MGLTLPNTSEPDAVLAVRLSSEGIRQAFGGSDQPVDYAASLAGLTSHQMQRLDYRGARLRIVKPSAMQFVVLAVHIRFLNRLHEGLPS